MVRNGSKVQLSVETFITQKKMLMVNVAPLHVCTRLFKKIRKEKMLEAGDKSLEQACRCYRQTKEFRRHVI